MIFAKDQVCKMYQATDLTHNQEQITQTSPKIRVTRSSAKVYPFEVVTSATPIFVVAILVPIKRKTRTPNAKEVNPSRVSLMTP
jgi:hypothetical protein